MTESNPSARVTLIGTPMAPPGHCGICGKVSDPKGFVDAQQSFEFYGALIFCSECVAEMARLYGYLSGEEYEKLEDEVQTHRFEISTLRAAVLNLEEVTDRLSADRLRDRGYVVEPSDSVSSESEFPEVSSESDSGTGPDDSETVKSADEPRPDDVRNDTKPGFDPVLGV